MTSPYRWRRLISLGALAIGIVVFVVTLRSVDLDAMLAMGRRLGIAIPLSLLVIFATHVIRTWAWSWCFAIRGAIPFHRLLRLRIAGEAISYLTISGVAGDSLKAMLLTDRVAGREAAASVALERIAYTVGAALLVGVAAVIALSTQPLSPGWAKTYRAFAVGAGLIAGAIALIVIRRDSYLLAGFRAIDRATGRHAGSGNVGRFLGDMGRDLGELICGDGRRLVVLAISAIAVYACMAAEVWVILRGVGVPITFAGATAVDTFTRVVSFATAPIPANIGTLEASNMAAVAAIGFGPAGAALALARRIRGLFWAGVGLAIYPRSETRRPKPDAGAITGNLSR